MFSKKSHTHRAERYRLEAAYLRTLISTLPDQNERAELGKIAAAYERVADNLMRVVETATG